MGTAASAGTLISAQQDPEQKIKLHPSQTLDPEKLPNYISALFSDVHCVVIFNAAIDR